MQHPAPLLGVCFVFVRMLAFLAAASPPRARRDLAPLRLGVWVGENLAGAGTGPLVCAAAGWAAALVDLLPATPADAQLLHAVMLTLSVSSLFANFGRLALSHPGPVESVEQGASDTGSICEACDARKPARAHHCSTCRRCALRMDHHCSWTGNCVGLCAYSRPSVFIQHIAVGGAAALT
jgi:ribosomal protein L40E